MKRHENGSGTFMLIIENSAIRNEGKMGIRSFREGEKARSIRAIPTIMKQLNIMRS